MLTGSVPERIASRRPVAVLGSSTSNAEVGHGVMQAFAPSGLQSASIGSEVSPLHAVTAATTRRQAVRIAGTVHGLRAAAANRLATRYNRIVRHAVVLAVIFLVSCGNPARTGPTGPTGGGTVTDKKPGPGTGSTGNPLVATDVGCPAPTCAFHANAAGYFVCMSGGAGSCFHYGPPCTPADSCMYDPSDRTYKQCSKPSEGKCEAWGAACAPATKCMVDPKDGYHRRCDDASGGTCKKFSALCAP